MASRVAEKVSDLGDRARHRTMGSRLVEADRENDRLSNEVRLLHEDLREDRGSLRRTLDSLQQRKNVTLKAPRRRGRLLRTVVLGAGAYLLGARAGRERYDQITEKVRSLMPNAEGRLEKNPESASWEGSGTSGTLVSSSPPMPGPVAISSPPMPATSSDASEKPGGSTLGEGEGRAQPVAAAKGIADASTEAIDDQDMP